MTDSDPVAHSTWTLIRINLLLVALGAVVGALVSIPLTELGKIIAQAQEPADTANYIWNAWSFGIIGAVLAPLLGWSWLRRVPLWRAALEPAALGLLGALAGMASGIGALSILGAIAGVTFSSWRLNRVDARRDRRVGEGSGLRIAAG